MRKSSIVLACCLAAELCTRTLTGAGARRRSAKGESIVFFGLARSRQFGARILQTCKLPFYEYDNKSYIQPDTVLLL